MTALLRASEAGVTCASACRPPEFVHAIGDGTFISGYTLGGLQRYAMELPTSGVHLPMPRSSQTKLARTLMSLSLDAPLVIAARTMRFSQPGALRSAKDQAEFLRMFTEKQAAAAESCMSLMMNAGTISQRMFLEFWSALASGNGRRGLRPPKVSRRATAKCFNDALEPYRRRAGANARRLGGRRKSR